jgi:hypothetical protein
LKTRAIILKVEQLFDNQRNKSHSGAIKIMSH